MEVRNDDDNPQGDQQINWKYGAGVDGGKNNPGGSTDRYYTRSNINNNNNYDGIGSIDRAATADIYPSGDNELYAQEYVSH